MNLRLNVRPNVRANVRTHGATLALALALALAAALAGCGSDGGSSSSGSASSTVTVAGDVPLAYVKRANTIVMNPTNGAPTAPGGDLLVREKSSPSAPEHNITESITQGKGDASDPEVSYDGKKIVFALRCPTDNTSKVGDAAACTGRWNIWEYDMTAGGSGSATAATGGITLTGGTLRRITASTDADDVDPAYLPGGAGFVFSSNRQTKSSTTQALGHTYFALDEYERERVFNLHTMDAQGGAITQISFNQSHDRNPVVRPNGDIMFARWDHVAGRNHFKIFRIKPDGTDLFVLYGAHSEGNSFLHPRDMDPAGKYKGFVASDLMPLSRTREGGGLVFIDAANYSEQNTPADSTVPPQGGQVQATTEALNIGGGLSRFGRITTPYPLWDGSNRVLMGYRPCEVTRDGVVVPCATLTDAELARLGDGDRLATDEAADPLKDNVPPSYAIYMFDPAQQTLLNVASPPAGFMYTDPIPLQPRAEPSSTPPTSVDATLAAQGLGLLEVRSVYDTDGLGRMGESMVAAADLPAGCTQAIALTKPSDTLDTRAQVADLVRMKDPADPAYGCAPARFVRAVRAVAPPSNTMGLRSAIGDTDFEMQQTLGYAPIAPDGSFKLTVPADTPIGLSVIDAKGRAFQTHTSWIQVRPGERRTCDGCHSPRRGAALNAGAVVNAVPAALAPVLAAAHQSGETLAATRARLDPTTLKLLSDMVYADVWADTTQTGVTAHKSISLRYTGNPDPADDLQTPVPANGIVNYVDHVQPLWTRPRGTGGANTCTNCHGSQSGAGTAASNGKLDLTATVAGTGRVASYERLMVGDPVIDATTGLPVTRIEDGVPMIVRLPALVDTGASEGDVTGLSRKSRLAEILFGEELMASGDARRIHPAPPSSAPDHASLLNAAEKRVLAEWIDLGGQYYNDPFNGASGVRNVVSLDQKSFTEQVFPVLTSTCAAGCHQAIGSEAKPAGTSFRMNRFVLTGDPDGDFNVTLTMISNTCTPASNYLLARPSTVPHPAGAIGQTAPVLPTNSAGYAAIARWIATGCPTP